jgi:hypothetical protein
VPELSAFEVEIAIENVEGYKSSGIYHIPAEMIKAGSRIVRSESHRLVDSFLNKKELPEQWKGSNSVPICKKGDKTECNNYRGISLLSPTYKSLSIILL